MEKRDDGMIEMEAGDEVLVVTAQHARGRAIVGTFTERRLADVGALAYSNEYGKNDDGALGPVVSTEVFLTCLDQHGVCPSVGTPVAFLVSGSPRPRRSPKSLVLNENDLSTITNALSGLASSCRRDAENAPDGPAGAYLRVAATQSADQYGALVLKIAEADEIEVIL